jgi:PAS domain S-box-containing protein
MVEDSADDTQLLMRELQKGGFEPEFRRVETAPEMSEALEAESWDLVISDHSMPGFGSLKALRLLQARRPDLPFIVVSGAIGEDIAVGVMKAGASDYVMKGNLARLAPSIERELREAESRRARRRAEDALAYAAAIVESSDDAIIGKTLDGIILSWNKGAERMYGYTAEEIIGRSCAILIPSYRPEELAQVYGVVRQGQLVEHYETVRIRKDGQALEVSLTLSPIKDSTGKILGVSAIERDISARRAEEAERVKLIQELTTALTSIRTLTGLLPICSSCKKIRDDRGYWQKVESYISQHTGAEFTHGICPECSQRLYPAYSRQKPPVTTEPVPGPGNPD